jgi:hypothetical protein
MGNPICGLQLFTVAARLPLVTANIAPNDPSRTPIRQIFCVGFKAYMRDKSVRVARVLRFCRHRTQPAASSNSDLSGSAIESASVPDPYVSCQRAGI